MLGLILRKPTVEPHDTYCRTCEHMRHVECMDHGCTFAQRVPGATASMCSPRDVARCACQCVGARSVARTRHWILVAGIIDVCMYQVAQNMVKVADDVILGLLLAGSPDPTQTKWFSCAVRLRAVLLGLACHRLLARAWLRAFGLEREEAEFNTMGMQTHLEEDFAMTRRKRHKHVGEFFQRDGTIPLLLAVLTSLSPVENLHFTLCKADAPRRDGARAGDWGGGGASRQATLRPNVCKRRRCALRAKAGGSPC